MDPPTFDNFVHYEREGTPDDDGCSQIYNLYGVRNAHDSNSIYLWRNYNTFDEDPTPNPEGFKLVQNGYIDCDDCNGLNGCCPEDLEKRKAYLEDCRFGSKVFAEDYVPLVVESPAHAEVVFTHDNGGRPFKVFIDHERKELHIYSVNRNIIYKSKSYR